MSLFQNSVLKKYLKGLESEKVTQAYEQFTSHFHNPTIQENIRNSKEEQYQGEFLIDLFVNVLGYLKNPTPNFNLTTELKNIKGSKKTDGAILSRDTTDASRDLSPLAKAVLELKGTNTTDLSKVETQVFGYKNNQPGCNYVITSNFEKLRFYIDNAVNFEEFNLFQLSKERFDILWLCLSSEYLLKDIPKKIKDESLTQEENVTKKLYKDYASFRNEIFDAIQKENPKYDKLTLFKKTQKLLDRFLFIFFAEDRLLLPPNSIRSIVNQWTDLRDKYDAYIPLYDRFKKYFGYMNTGHKGQQHDIFAYNGGLFAPDENLDNIKINDDLLYKHTLNLSNYDFESEVSVNILGHIFEHSLNDIDEIQNAISNNLNALKSIGKRKKDGVFYTPKYITKYIVDNTVGKLCEEKKKELDIQEAEYEKERKGRQKATLKKLTQKLEDYRKWLLQITICDPACGSGAFLNQALEFLIAEHRYIDELQAKLFGDAMVLSEVENSILENNLFGVDINEESVEIAKLSLWLRTAQKGRKLTSLNNNIKCGNSLIDDPTVAGDKAFHWQTEFSEIFKEKHKKAYHITTAIHDSRTSARMQKYKVRERRDGGTNPYPNVIYFTEEDDLIITQTIANIVKEDKLNLLAYNICADHIHLMLVCDIEEIPAIMQKIKGRTSYYKKLNHKEDNHKEDNHKEDNHKGLKSLEKKPLWSQKYSAPKEIVTQEQLDNTLRYIQNNRNKHELPAHSKKVQDIIDNMCCTVEHAFTPEYKGGFDVVIGNPPYGASFDKKEKEYIENNYKSYQYKFESYLYFYEKGIQILKQNGILAYITPELFLRLDKSFNIRNFININSTPIELKFCGEEVFQDVKVNSVVVTISKSLKEKGDIRIVQENGLDWQYNLDRWRKDENLIFDYEINPFSELIINKIKNSSILLGDIGSAIQGLTPYDSYKGQSKEIIKSRAYHHSEKIDDTCGIWLDGKNISRYYFVEGKEWLQYGDWLASPRDPKYFVGPRLLFREVPGQKKRIQCSYAEEKYYYGHSVTPFLLSLKYEKSMIFRILALVNSNLISWYASLKVSNFAKKTFPKLNPKDIKSLPIVSNVCEKESIRIEENSIKLIELYNMFNSIIQSFLKFISAKTTVSKFTRKLQNWHELDFGEFLKELEKARQKTFKLTTTDLSPLGEYKKLTLSEEAEWMSYFNEQKQIAQSLKAVIDKTDKEIDAMVYKLYGLTDDEIAIVEEATK